MDIASLLAMTLGSAWASGINLYATVFVLGMANNSGTFTLPDSLQMLGDPWVMTAAGAMYLVEFLVDKIPGLDSVWDTISTFIRIPAGAALAGGMMGDMGTGAEMAAALVGGGLTAATHAAKSGSRVLINTSPEPFSNWGASIGEDVSVFAGLWAALHHPVLFLALLALFILLLVWLLPKVWRGIKKVFGFIGRMFSGGDKDPADSDRRDGDPPPS
jgi:hypothetical protein